MLNPKVDQSNVLCFSAWMHILQSRLQNIETLLKTNSSDIATQPPFMAPSEIGAGDIEDIGVKPKPVQCQQPFNQQNLPDISAQKATDLQLMYSTFQQFSEDISQLLHTVQIKLTTKLCNQSVDFLQSNVCGPDDGLRELTAQMSTVAFHELPPLADQTLAVQFDMIKSQYERLVLQLHSV